MLWALFMTFTLGADERGTVFSEVPCTSVKQCWLDADGKPIARPKKLRGAPLPKRDCDNTLWLQHQLSCDEKRHVCASKLVLNDPC